MHLKVLTTEITSSKQIHLALILDTSVIGQGLWFTCPLCFDKFPLSIKIILSLPWHELGLVLQVHAPEVVHVANANVFASEHVESLSLRIKLGTYFFS
jgi:hypothetical protein